MLRNIGNHILDDESVIDVCSLLFTDPCVKRDPFRVQTSRLNVKYKEMWRKRKIQDAAESVDTFYVLIILKIVAH
jgi:hypothetical protein